MQTQSIFPRIPSRHAAPARCLPTLLAMAGVVIGAALFAPTADALQTLQHGPVTYVSGGIGADEAAAMKEAAGKFPLEILFVEKDESGRRAYSANNRVVVLDAAGESMLNTSSDGPYMLIDLPPGRYTVLGEAQGRYRRQVVRLAPGGHQRIVFEWQAAP